MKDRLVIGKVLKPIQSGASLIGALIALAIVGSLVFIYLESKEQLQKSQRHHQAGMAAKDIENVILSTIINREMKFIKDKCSTNISSEFDNIAVGAFTLRQRQPVFRLPDRVTQTSAPSSATAAVNRCNTTSGYPGTDQSRHYHCLRIETTSPKTKAGRHTFAQNLGAFIEVHVKIKDLATNDSVSCSDAFDGGEPRGKGIEAYYNLHWTISDSKGSILYKNKMGSVRVALR